jgi:hypothetical protein
VSALRPARVAVVLIIASVAPPGAAADGVRWSVGPRYDVRLPAPSSTGTHDGHRPRAAAARSRPGRWAPRRAIGTWLEVSLGEIRSHAVNPARAARALALVSVAMNDAIQTLRLATRSPARPSAEAAAAGRAAALVLAHVFPDRSRALVRLGAVAVSRSGASDPESASYVGSRIAQRVIAIARQDGSDATWSGVRPSGPGLWEPTPPAFAPPLEPLVGTWRTWNLNRAAQFRPEPPPRPGSDRFDAEAQEVYDVSRILTDRQRRLALFWADGPGTATPPGHWNVIALRMMRGRTTGPARAALVLAALNTAQSDAFIACWDAKYAYWSVRPVTTIRQWWFDPSWSPLLPTPPFPSYVSGHATTSAAAARVLGRFFPSERTRLARLADDAAQSRLFAGIHFASDTIAGLTLGRKVAGAALRRMSQDSTHWR